MCYWEALCMAGTIPELSESRRRYLYCHIIAGVENHQLVPGMIAVNIRRLISCMKIAMQIVHFENILSLISISVSQL